MDLTARRAKLIEELTATKAEATAAAERAEALDKRAFFLQGAIAVLNDLLKVEPKAEPAAEAPPPAVEPKLSRSQRRRLERQLADLAKEADAPV